MLRFKIKTFNQLSKWELKQINYYLETNFHKKSLEFFKPFISYSKFIILEFQKFIIGFINFISVKYFFELYTKIVPGELFPLPIITMNGIFINNLFIHTKNRGKKLGTLLVKSSLKYIKKNDMDHVICQVLEENIKAKNLYLKLNFKTFLSGYDPITNKKLLILYKNI